MSTSRTPPKRSKELENAVYDEWKRKAVDTAKKRAVAQYVDYDTFKNMVLVAHLKPIGEKEQHQGNQKMHHLIIFRSERDYSCSLWPAGPHCAQQAPCNAARRYSLTVQRKPLGAGSKFRKMLVLFCMCVSNHLERLRCVCRCDTSACLVCWKGWQAVGKAPATANSSRQLACARSSAKNVFRL